MVLVSLRKYALDIGTNLFSQEKKRQLKNKVWRAILDVRRKNASNFNHMKNHVNVEDSIMRKVCRNLRDFLKSEWRIQMIWSKPLRILSKPFVEMFRRLSPLRFAQWQGVNMGNNVHIYGPVDWGTEPWLITLGDNVYITAGCRFVNHDGGTLIFRKEYPDLEITKPIVVGSNVYIGRDSLLLPGACIGNNVVIGARSVVTKKIGDNSVAVGAPARVIKSTEEYLEKLKRESLGLGHLKGKEKDEALKKYYKYKE